MAGTVLSVGIVLCAATLTSCVAVVAGGAVVGQRAAGAADAAALAAADAASGAIQGVPCERAAQIAASVGATLTACELDGLVATVTVSVALRNSVCSGVSARGTAELRHCSQHDTAQRCVWCATKKGRPRWQQARSSSSSSHRRR